MMSSQPQPTNTNAAAAGNGQGSLRVTPQVILSRAPVGGAVFGQVNIATPLQIRAAMEDARNGQRAWEGLGLPRRLLFMQAVRDALYRQRERVLSTLVGELGKVYAEAQLEYLATIELLSYFMQVAERVLAPRPKTFRLVPYHQYVVKRQPYGVALVIAPWNYPLFLSMSPILAALIGGNSVIYKPSEYATQVGEVIASMIAEAGIPPEVFQIVHGYGDVGAALIDAQPDLICFTGSVATGKKVAHAAAEHLIPVTLELGGNDAAIVLDDAAIDFSADGIAWSGMFNAGQTCASVERVIALEAVHDRFVASLQRAVERYLGTPDGSPSPSLAALTMPGQRETVQGHIDDALAQGATLVMGGGPLPRYPDFFAPTLLTGVTPQMRIAQEETFGPVIAVMQARDEDEAIRLANSTDYGLAASVWTRSPARGRRVANRIQAGNVSLNEHLLISGVPVVPWGGIKASGYGRTSSTEGLLEVTYAKSMMVDGRRLPRALELFWYPYTPLKRGLITRLIHALYGPTWRDRLRAFLP
ncbi:MAG: aldehyde dehydrogenase family protein [Anaerolineae bacterium]|nr:aldehyde dehydrogenase family protein [Anaerolineae bacterium]